MTKHTTLCFQLDAAQKKYGGNDTDTVTDTVVKNVKQRSATIKRKKRGSPTSEDLTTTGPTPASLSSTSATSEGLPDNSTTTTEPTTVGSNATTPQPNDLAPVRNITVIGEETMKVLQEADYKNEFVKCLVENGLHVNAKDSKGCTMLALVQKEKKEGKDKLDLFKYLGNQTGVDKNVECLK